MTVYTIEATANKGGNLINLYLGNWFGRLNCLTIFDDAIKFHDRQSAEAVLEYFNTIGTMPYDYQVTEHEIASD